MKPPVPRVVVTGLGVASSLGLEIEDFWQAVIEGRSGIDRIRQFDSTCFPVRIGGEVPALPPGEAAEQPNRTLRFAVWAADRAITSAGLEPQGEPTFDPSRGVCLGAGVFPVIEDHLDDLEFDGDWLSTRRQLQLCRRRPEIPTRQDLALVSSTLSRRFAFGGPSRTVQSACASSTQAIGEAFRSIRDGDAEVMLTGGADSMMSMFCVAGFTLLGALSQQTEPRRASRPFDQTRDGFVLGEGAGMLVLESLEHAEARGAKILAELIGYGSSADCYRFTDIEPRARGAIRSLQRALADAGLRPEEVDHINAHGTATPQNDAMETLALKSVFQEHAYRLAISANKSQIGHLLCAAGGIEMVLTVLSLERRILPPTLNLETPDPECDLDYVPGSSRRADVSVALSNSFGFGGQNATLAVRRWEGAP